MDEATYRLNQAAKRMFGPGAMLTGSLGSGRAPGELRIVIDGRQIGMGRTFEQALQDTSRRQREAVR